MRILQVNKFLYRRGGAEAYMLDLSEVLRSAGHEVAFFGMQHPSNPPLPFQGYFPTELELEPPPPGLVGRAQVAGRMMWSTSARRGIASVLREFRPDVVHLHNVYHHLSPSILRAIAMSGAPAVMTLHDYKLVCPTYQLLDQGEVCTACVGGHFHEAVRRGCRNGSRSQSALMAAELAVHTWTGAYGSVDRFICPSEFLAEQMRAGGVYPDKLRVVNNFCDADLFDAKESAGGPVVYAGRLSAEKGIDTLIRAIGLVPDATCVIAGEGPQRSALEQLAATCAAGRVSFVGRLPREEVQTLLRSAAVVCLPARWHENQPMLVLEAYAAGVPVIASTLGGLPELVSPGSTGLLVPPNDPSSLAAAINEVLSDPERAQAMGRAGRELAVEEFNPAVHLQRILSVYKEAGA